MIHLVSADDARAVAARLAAAPRVALDTEFHAENRYLPDLFLIQLGLDGGDVFLVDPLVSGVLDVIGPALTSRPWVLHAGEHDLRVLTAVFGDGPAAPVFDTQIAAGLAGATWPAGYAALCDTWLGVAVDKAETLSDWSRRPLSSAQLAYAAADVVHLLPLADALAADLAARGRTTIAAEACAEAAAAAEGPDLDRVLADLTANTSLDGRQAAVLRRLLAWREERARAQNTPPRTIAGDGILLDIARREPRSAAELTSSRRFPKNVARHADDLVAAILDAVASPTESWPPVVRRNTAAARRSAFLQVWAAVEGQRSGWAGSLVMAPRIAAAIACGRPLTGWRSSVAGAALDEVLAGRVGLYWGDGDVDDRGSA